MNNAKHLRKVLGRSIKKLATKKQNYLFNPEKDFTRSGPLTFESIVETFIKIGCGPIRDELLKCDNLDSNTVTTSGFVQARSKIRFDAFMELFSMFNQSTKQKKFYKGYGLIAIDGSSIPISYDKNDEETYCANNGMN